MADPARIASVIGGVSGELSRWCVAATSAIEEADQAVRWGAEHVQRADHVTNIANDLAGQQRGAVENEKRSSERTVESARDASASEQRLHDGALARPIGPGESGELAAIAREGHAVDCVPPRAGIGHDQIVERDHDVRRS